MKHWILVLTLLVYSCKTDNHVEVDLEPDHLVDLVEPVKAPEEAPEVTILVEETLKTPPPLVEVVPVIEAVEEAKVLLEPVPIPEVTIVAEPVAEIKMEKTIVLPVEEVKLVEVVKVIEPTPEKAPEVVPKPSIPLLKLNGYKTLLKYSISSSDENSLYCTEASIVEVDGKKLQKIKLASSGMVVNLPIARKLKSGKTVVEAIVTINEKTAKIECLVIMGKHAMDFAISSSSLRQF
jgi:hypothetical protein